jgi:protein-S-isoprenylcysteine O-methyltransferase Ste14
MSAGRDFSNKHPILPPTYLLIALSVMLGLHFIFPAYKFIPIPWNLLGLLPLGMGVAINITADKRFHQVETTVKPYEKPRVLITDGVFNFSRNPMYLGFAMILLGVALLLSSLTPFMVIPVFIALMEIKFIRVEELMLANTFGPDWQEYVQNVRRWI